MWMCKFVEEIFFHSEDSNTVNNTTLLVSGTPLTAFASLHVRLLVANCADERGQTDRQKDIQTDRQTDRQRDIQTDRQTD